MYRYTQYAFALFALVYMSGAITFILTPTGSANSPVWQQLGLAIGAVAALDLFRMLNTSRVRLEQYSAIALLVAFAAMTIVWSVDIDIAMRRVGALLLTAIFGIWLAETFKVRQIVNLVMAALFVVCAASAVAIVAFPDFGVHQATNIIAETSVGAWRGMYSHKNDFGRAVSLAVVVFFVVALNRRRWRWMYLSAAALAAVLVVGADSSQAIILAVLGVAGGMLAMMLRRRTAAERAMTLIFLVPFSIVVFALSNIVAPEVLGALGKDFTFSDRTEIWAVVIDSIQNHILLGGGYGAGWEMVADPIAQRFGRAIGHAHNGYLQLVVNIGLLGTALTMGVFFYTGAIAFIQLMRGKQTEFASFWLAYQVYFLVGNMAASFALEYNSLDFVLFVIAGAVLRRTETRTQWVRVPTQQWGPPQSA